MGRKSSRRARTRIFLRREKQVPWVLEAIQHNGHNIVVMMRTDNSPGYFFCIRCRMRRFFPEVCVLRGKSFNRTPCSEVPSGQ